MQHPYLSRFTLIALLLFFGVSAYNQTTTVDLVADRDNSIYSENNNSNGAGSHLFTGRTNQGNLRRALVRFDLSSIPAGATINNAELQIVGNRQSTSSVSAHLLTSDWGESNSNATGQEGQGAAPSMGDATWAFNFFSTDRWTSEGGDFESNASASTGVSSGNTSVWDGSGIVEDVQAWIDGDADNFGWILIGNENSNNSAVRMNARENGGTRPTLRVTYTVSCDADGGTLTGGPFTFCVGDGQADMIPDGAITLEGNSGANSQWVVTDDQGNILGLPASPFDVDFDGAGAGTCLVWHLSFEDGLTGAAVGNNASDLMGCFDLSNPITVTRNQPDGGTLTGGPFTFCVGDGQADMIPDGAITLEGNSGANSQWVVTDDQGNILGLPASPFDVDFDGAGAGTCLVWHLSFEDGLTGAAVGNNASDLMGCFDLSNPITVTRNQPDGGTLTGGPFTFCVGDGQADMIPVEAITLEGNSGANSQWVVTDDQGNILGLPASPFDVDFDGAGPGTCLVWHLSFEDGLTGAAVGNNASDLMGCFDLSNPITVTRNQPDGGTLTGGPFTFCVGDGQADMIPDGAITLEGNTGGNSQWVVTDDQGNILGLPASPFDVDFDGAGPGTCLVWHLSFEDGLTGAAVGNNASDLMGCFDLSNPITVNRNQPDGGTLTGGPFTFCVGDGQADMIPDGAITLEGNSGPNSAWVVTDDQGNILGLPASPFDVDFDGAGAGTCLVWHLSFEDGLTGAAVGNNASDLMGCFDLSNPITVTRNQPDGGTLTGGPFTFCVGDGQADMIPDGAITLEGNTGGNSQWVVTDDQGNILGLPASPFDVDFDGAGPGTCLVWHLSFEDGLTGAAVGNNASDLMGCFDLSNPITVNRNQPDGGTLTGGPFTFCVGDGLADMIPDGAITLEGNSGPNSAWVVTDDQGNILGLPASPFDVDFDGAGPGTCLVWHLSFEDGLTGAAVGNNASDLMGCFDLSNPITVNRNGVNGGNLTTASGETMVTICAGDEIGDPIVVNLTDTVGTNSAWVVTDEQGNILALPPSPPFDLDGAGPGICLIWHLSFEDGLTGAEVGNNASDLMGCFDLSNPITVNRIEADPDLSGGSIALADGGTSIDICAGDGMSDAFTVTLTDASGMNSAWVITDADANILALADTNVFDLDGAGPGVCLIWHLSFSDGLTGAAVGNNAADLQGCFDLSNPITVNRSQPDGGTLTGGPFTFCVGDDGADMIPDGAITLEGNSGANSQWVVTDDQGNILGLPASPFDVDFDGAGPGTCLVWHLSFEDGLTGAAVGNNASDLMGCFDLSNPITVNRIEADSTLSGGSIELADGGTSIDICAGDGMSDAFTVNLTGAAGMNSAWVITDADANILALADTNVFDLDGAGPGVCLIWHLSFSDGLMGAAVGNNAADLMGCFDLSNPITVNRSQPDGGTLTGGPFTFCVGNGQADTIPDGAITLEGNSGANSQWVVTDDQGNILGLPASPFDVDFDGAGPGTCLVWHLSFEDGLTGAAVGNNAADLMGCFDLSNPITVIRNQPDGGTLTGGPFTFCVGDGIADTIPTGDITLEGNSGANSQWVVTDDQGNILGLPASPFDVDFDGAGPGTCLVWHLSFEDGLTGAAVGNNAADLMGCFDLSNPITVNRDTTGSACVTSTNVIEPAAIQFELWPNPAQQIINITAQLQEQPRQLQVEVRSAIGQVLIREQIAEQREVNEQINIGELPQGIYLLSLRTENGIVTKRFLKK